MAGSDDGDDREARLLFREAMRDVRQLDAPARAPAVTALRGPISARPRRPPTPDKPDRELAGARSMADALAGEGLPMVGRGEPLEYRAPGVATSTVRQLRRGHYPVEGGVDLHGLTGARATAVLRDFMTEARSERARCVKVVHGKGIGSGERGPVLKTLANAWLREQPDVLAFVSAPPHDGGTGAVYVLLRRVRREAQD